MRKSVEIMSNPDCLLKIKTLFEDDVGSNNASYSQIVHNTLEKILPKSLCNPKLVDPDLLEDQQAAFFASLPLLTSSPCEKAPGNISFFVVSKFRPNAFKFFFNIISHWLVPGKRLNTLLLYAVDFQLPEFGEDIYTLCEIMVRIEDRAELEELHRNLPIIETEVRLGMQSAYYARRILEVKGLAVDAKTAMIQEYIASLIARMPESFDQDLLTEMQHVLVICRDEFKAERECRHLSRIISVHYLFRKGLHKSVKIAPEKRHLNIKFFKTILHLPDGDKHVLGVLVGITFLRDKEVFEERHLLSAIQNYLPAAQPVELSFFSNRRGHENICTLYLEIKKQNGEAFTADEISILRRELPIDLKDRIEHLMHPVFMPRNEEEVMRNILSLSNQIKYLHDFPQVILSFDKQTHSDLFFTIIMVRVMQPGSLSIQDIFKKTDTFLGYIHDRSKTVGFLRKKYTKEATVFAVKLTKDQFLRRDHTIDLNKARQTVVKELMRILGDIRDFNGGMISKQNELLCAIREQLGSGIKYNDLLLENFFYSLSPDIMRTVLEPRVLKTLFLLLLESIEKGFFSGENYALNIRCDSQHVFAMIKMEERSIKDVITRALNKFDHDQAKLAHALVSVYDISYLGYIYLCNESDQQQAFCQLLQNNLMQMGQPKVRPQIQLQFS